MRIILIGNYRLDRQESMIRFAEMLHSGYLQAGVSAEIWQPLIFFGAGQKITNNGFGKWLGYIDKWFIYPLVLRLRLLNKALHNSDIRFHVCDHSNAPYLKYLPANRTSITCHDVLAIRGALGYADAYAPASRFGKTLQRWIFHHLSRAKHLATVSQFTLNQLHALTKDSHDPEKDWRVIHNAFNANFKLADDKKREALLGKTGLTSGIPFILHVGSGQLRKNRRLLIDMIAALDKKWDGKICFAGEAVDNDLMMHARSLNVNERIISVVSPDHDVLTALYSSCTAFIFPSFSEGFGWPLIEAQACGAPVIASNVEPMPEISGGTAIHADPNKSQDFANAFLLLKDEVFRMELIKRGYENIHRFQLDKMINKYIDLQKLKVHDR